MLFNSIQFLIFFPLVAIAYFLLPHRFRWVLLLAASYYFYMCWDWVYIFLIVGVTLIDYVCAIWLESTRDYAKKTMKKRTKLRMKVMRRVILLIVLLSNLGPLFYYKYLGFAMSSMQGLADMAHLSVTFPVYHILLPVGISFFTFQAMAYFFDVYKGARKAERHFGYFALFISFFPQLVAGPIERSTNLLPQFFKKHEFNYEDASTGLRLAAWGMFKKVVVADRAALIVNSIYNSPEGHVGWSLIIATVVFAFQIFCDFSGYSDIAIGVARVLGFRLMKNFDRPYSAKSIAEFWRKWHISLSTWFKDYVYIPMGGSRVSIGRWAVNAMVVFLVSGLWHGADWTFVAWGALLGAWQVVGRFTQRFRDWIWEKLGFIQSVRGAIAICITFAFVCVTWVFFRANNFADCAYIFRNIMVGLDFASFKAVVGEIGKNSLAILGASILAMEVGQWAAAKCCVSRWHWALRWGSYVGLIAWTLIFAQYGSQQFIYFQF